MEDDTTNNPHDEKIESEIEDLKAEMKELKKIIKDQKKESRSREHRDHGPRREFRFNFDDDFGPFDEFEDIGDTFGAYIEGVMAGVADKLRKSMETFSDGFGDFDEKMKIKDDLKKNLKRNLGKSIRFTPLSQEELSQFYEIAPNLTAALSDTRRLMLLRALEEGPKYQGDLAEMTDLKGGAFKHHMDTLLELGYVYQEASRGRYLIKQLGIEALKLSEMLFRRYNAEAKTKSVEVEYVDDNAETIDDTPEQSDQTEAADQEDKEEEL